MDKLERVIEKWDKRHKWNLHKEEKLALIEDIMESMGDNNLCEKLMGVIRQRMTKVRLHDRN